LEHASIASFARFTLELLSVGAPPRLIVASQDAGRDEVHHAQMCFAIASRFARKKLGPGRLDVDGVVAARDLISIVLSTVKEGCVVETLSALLAKERALLARDDDVRAALEKIADDEKRHADLAWTFVGWAISREGTPMKETAIRAFEWATERPPLGFDSALRGLSNEVVRAHGLLDEGTARAVTERALREIIAPRVAELATY